MYYVMRASTPFLHVHRESTDPLIYISSRLHKLVSYA